MGQPTIITRVYILGHGGLSFWCREEGGLFGNAATWGQRLFSVFHMIFMRFSLVFCDGLFFNVYNRFGVGSVGLKPVGEWVRDRFSQILMLM